MHQDNKINNGNDINKHNLRLDYLYDIYAYVYSSVNLWYSI